MKSAGSSFRGGRGQPATDGTRTGMRNRSRGCVQSPRIEKRGSGAPGQCLDSDMRSVAQAPRAAITNPIRPLLLSALPGENAEVQPSNIRQRACAPGGPFRARRAGGFRGLRRGAARPSRERSGRDTDPLAKGGKADHKPKLPGGDKREACASPRAGKVSWSSPGDSFPGQPLPRPFSQAKGPEDQPSPLVGEGAVRLRPNGG